MTFVMLKDDLDWVVGICFGEISPAEIVKHRMNCTERPYLFGVLGRVEVGLRRIKQVTNIMLDPLEVSEGELTFFSYSSEFTDFWGSVNFQSDEFSLFGCSQTDGKLTFMKNRNLV